MNNDPTVLAVITPIDVDVDNLSEEQLEILAEIEAQKERDRVEMLENLAISIRSKFTERAARRTLKENQWLRSAKLYYGKLADGNTINRGETPWDGRVTKNRPDVNIVRSKCSIAIAQTVSMQFGTSNKNWDIWPDVDDNDPANAAACAAMSDAIESQLEKTKYSTKCRQAMWDRVVLGTGVLKGPLSTGQLVRSYKQINGTETWVPDLTVDNSPKLERINPWFFYPDESVEHSECLQDCIEVHPMTALELKKLMKHDGFRSDAILAVLESKPEEYVSENWKDFATLSDNNANLYRNRYVVLEYHGPITKNQLEHMEIETTYDSINDEYYGEVWACQGQIIRIELSTIEAAYTIPYYMCDWESDPASVFGFGVPLMMEDAQRVVNESWHMILDNSSLSSGPQVAMQKGLIEPANGKWELTPGQMWYLTDPMAQVSQAIQFFNVPNVTENIVPIMQMAQGFAEEESGIPLITAGLTSPEVGDTATGQLMVRTASTTLLDFMSEDWDDSITAPIIEAWYAWNMQYNRDPEVKGAFSVDVRTSTEYKNKQLHIRDLEKLSVEMAQNPEMAKRIDAGQLSKLRLELMELPSKTIIKSDEQVAAEEAAAAANATPPVELMQLQLDARKLALEEAKLAFESKQAQQREIWEHEERMAAAGARLVESQARVTVSQNEKEIEILKLGQKDTAEAAKILSNEKITRENNQTKLFQTGLTEARKQQEADSYQAEIDLAATKGQGV